MPFNIALSGLNAAQKDLEVTGNNIANASTNGFKESRAEFSDVYAATTAAVGSTESGKGVKVARVAQQFSQGTIDFTSNSLDLAISGEGFFVLSEPGQQTFSYTRAGAYNVDKDGFIVNSAGDRLQAYPVATAATATTSATFNTSLPGDVLLPVVAGAPQTTSILTASVNLDSSAVAPVTPWVDPTIAVPANPASYNSSTALTVYDSQGNARTATMYFIKTASNTWDGRLFVNDISGAPQPVEFAAADPTFDLVFNTDGSLATVQPFSMVTIPAATLGGGVADMPMTMNFTGTTQYGSSFAVNSLTQDGFTTGRLASVDIDAEGVIFSRFTNGQSIALGQVAIVRFSNTQGLAPTGNSKWVETNESGAALLGQAASGSFGAIQSGALESSTTDIAAQLVNLITAQRNFQANAQVISTADTVTQTIINI